MVGAMIEGLGPSIVPSEWGIYSPSGVSAKQLAVKVGAKHVTDLDSISPDWVIIGCKPQQLKELAVSIKGKFENALYISLLAAIPERDQLNTLGVRRLVRVMPNMSVRFNVGVTLLSSISAPDELGEVQKLFSRLGMARVMDEESLQELTLLTGSGPALFYEFTQDLSRCFSSLDGPSREALARQVLLGAGISASKENLPLGTMIDAVTSKGGVTIAVLESWRGRKFIEVLKVGITAGLKRTQELMQAILQS